MSHSCPLSQHQSILMILSAVFPPGSNRTTQLVIGLGNPQVFLERPVPDPSKTHTLMRGRGFHRFGCGFRWVVWVWKPTQVNTTGGHEMATLLYTDCYSYRIQMYVHSIWSSDNIPSGSLDTLDDVRWALQINHCQGEPVAIVLKLTLTGCGVSSMALHETCPGDEDTVHLWVVKEWEGRELGAWWKLDEVWIGQMEVESCASLVSDSQQQSEWRFHTTNDQRFNMSMWSSGQMTTINTAEHCNMALHPDAATAGWLKTTNLRWGGNDMPPGNCSTSHDNKSLTTSTVINWSRRMPQAWKWSTTKWITRSKISVLSLNLN